MFACRGCENLRLVLENRYTLDLVNTFYVPSFSKNLISISKLVSLGFEFNFIGSNVYLFNNSTDVGSGILANGLYKLNLDPIYEQSLLTMHDNGSKRNIIDESSSMLWHRRLGHISVERIKRLINDGVLNALDFSDFGTYVDCIKESKPTRPVKVQRGVKKYLESYTLTYVDHLVPHV